MRRKDDVWDWDITCLNPADYELDFVFAAKNKVMAGLLEKTKREVKKRKGLDVDGCLDNVTAFDIEPVYFNTIKVFLSKPYGITRRDIGKDGIELLNYDVVGGRFVREGDVWKIHIKVSGTYTDKR